MFFSCGSTNCLDCWTPDLGKWYHSDNAFDARGEMERQTEGVLKMQTNSWADAFGNIYIHDDN